MNTINLFKSTSKVQPLQDTVANLVTAVNNIETLTQGKVEYFGNAIEASNSDRDIDELFEKIEMAQGFESEAYRGLHNAFLYAEKLSQL